MEGTKHTIIIHYSEIALKGKNRAYFEDALVSAIKKMLAGTSLKNTPARAMSGLSQSQETTTRLHPEVRRGEVTPDMRESAIAQGVAALSPSRGVTPQSQCPQHSSLGVPCEDVEIARNAGRDIFERGSRFSPVARKITGRIIVECVGEREEIAVRLTRVFGIKNFSFARVVPAEIAAMKEAALALLEGARPASFRITASRSEKNYPFTSQEIAVAVGAHLFETTGTRVDLHAPELDIHIEAVEGRAFVYSEKLAGPDGLPFGVSGKIVSLISGGFDSPVASWRMMRRGCRPVFLHFHSYPQTGRESIENVERIVAELARFAPEPLTLYLVPFLDIQKLIALKVPLKYAIILYRRAMLRIAERVAERENAKALVTGDSVGQVASQTLDNIAAISAAVKIPILRPLAGDDKEEIIALARRIGTHDLSAKPFDDCCSLFTSGSPETHAKLVDIEAAEAPIASELIALCEQAFGNAEYKRF